MRSILGILFLITLSLFACRYDDELSVKYIGKYSGLYTRDLYGGAGSGHSESTQTLSVTQGSTDSTYSIAGIDWWLGADGCGSIYHGSVCLTGDSLHLIIMNGGLGGGVYERFNGVKISNRP
jgi:hypothetical protein